MKPEHRRHGIGTALLTQLVRANPDHSTISVSFVAGKPVLRSTSDLDSRSLNNGPTLS